MRRIKKLIKYTTVSGVNAVTDEQLFIKQVSGSTNEAKEAKAYFKDHKYVPLKIELVEVEETRVMSGEDFIKYSKVLQEDE